MVTYSFFCFFRLTIYIYISFFIVFFFFKICKMYTSIFLARNHEDIDNKTVDYFFIN